MDAGGHMALKPINIAIVGGGTAGWLAANHLGKSLQSHPNINITVIESPNVPTIGVGEGTVPAIRQSLKSFGISETELLRRCDATFKQSIKFCNWLDKDNHGQDNFYHHLFDKPQAFSIDLTPLWLNQSEQHFADLVSVQHQVCEQQRAPKTITTAEWDAVVGYAYHIDAAKFAQLLSDNAQQAFNVEYLQQHITSCQLDQQGNISALVTQEQQLLKYDFYIDCSGTACLLLGQALQIPFISVADKLLIDSALVVQVPTATDVEIPPYTIATAHQAGWIWDIALTHRRGVGFVYSSQYMDEQCAEDKLRHYLADDNKQLSFRKIPMNVGYRQQSWANNCVALGLAQGFVEPLEATSIMLTDFAAKLLAEKLPVALLNMDLYRERYNQVMHYAWLSVIDFIQLHYYLSDRTDSEFWRANQNKQHLSTELQQRLQLWQHAIPLATDFFSKFEAFDLDNYLYVLYGMKFNTQMTTKVATANVDIKPLGLQRQYVLEQLPSHRQLLNKIALYGLQKN